MSDGISEEDLLLSMDKTEIEKKILAQDKTIEKLQRAIQIERKIKENEYKIFALELKKVNQTIAENRLLTDNLISKSKIKN